MSKTLDQISKLQDQIALLKDAAALELVARRTQLRDELKSIEAELENLTGKPARARRASVGLPASPSGLKSGVAEGKKPDLQELKALLASAPGKTISLRKEGYNVRNVKILAMANPTLLRMGGKGAWPEVTLLK